MHLLFNVPLEHQQASESLAPILDSWSTPVPGSRVVRGRVVRARLALAGAVSPGRFVVLEEGLTHLRNPLRTSAIEGWRKSKLDCVNLHHLVAKPCRGH